MTSNGEKKNSVERNCTHILLPVPAHIVFLEGVQNSYPRYIYCSLYWNLSICSTSNDTAMDHRCSGLKAAESKSNTSFLIWPIKAELGRISALYPIQSYSFFSSSGGDAFVLVQGERQQCAQRKLMESAWIPQHTFVLNLFKGSSRWRKPQFIIISHRLERRNAIRKNI